MSATLENFVNTNSGGLIATTVNNPSYHLWKNRDSLPREYLSTVGYLGSMTLQNGLGRPLELQRFEELKQTYKRHGLAPPKRLAFNRQDVYWIGMWSDYYKPADNIIGPYWRTPNFPGTVAPPPEDAFDEPVHLGDYGNWQATANRLMTDGWSFTNHDKYDYPVKCPYTLYQIGTKRLRIHGVRPIYHHDAWLDAQVDLICQCVFADELQLDGYCLTFSKPWYYFAGKEQKGKKPGGGYFATKLSGVGNVDYLQHWLWDSSSTWDSATNLPELPKVLMYDSPMSTRGVEYVRTNLRLAQKLRDRFSGKGKVLWVSWAGFDNTPPILPIWRHSGLASDYQMHFDTPEQGQKRFLEDVEFINDICDGADWPSTPDITTKHWATKVPYEEHGWWETQLTSGKRSLFQSQRRVEKHMQ